MKNSTLAMIQIGYGPKIVLPIAKATKVFELLADATIVDNRWSEHIDGSTLVEDDNASPSLSFIDEPPMTRRTYDAMVEAAKAEKEANTCAPVGVEPPADFRQAMNEA
jgi:hypothetical protein